MSIASWIGPGVPAERAPAAAGARPRAAGWATVGARSRRGLLLAALFAGAGIAAWATGRPEAAEAAARAGDELTRLLRCMALLKAAMAAAALGAVWWRLALPAGALRLAAYLAAGAAAAAGPVLIWGMVHLGLGSLLLHGGLFASLVLLWRDPDVAARLGALVAERRRAIASR